MVGASYQELLGCCEKLPSLFNHSGNFLAADHRLEPVIGMKPPIKRIEYVSVKLRMHQSGSGEVLSEKGMNSAVLSRAQPFIAEQGLGGIKHGVLGASRSEVRVPVLKQYLRCLGCAPSLFQQVACFGGQTEIASSRRLARKAPSAFRHESSETNTRLMLIPCARDTLETSSLVRSISAP